MKKKKIMQWYCKKKLKLFRILNKVYLIATSKLETGTPLQLHNG